MLKEINGCMVDMNDPFQVWVSELTSNKDKIFKEAYYMECVKEDTFPSWTGFLGFRYEIYLKEDLYK